MIETRYLVLHSISTETKKDVPSRRLVHTILASEPTSRRTDFIPARVGFPTPNIGKLPSTFLKFGAPGMANERPCLWQPNGIHTWPLRNTTRKMVRL